MCFFLSISVSLAIEQRKLDLAARRIAKVVKFTVENDELRKQYVAHAKSFTERVARVRVVLNDRSIDNTMAGARAKIEAFDAYKKSDKSAILADQVRVCSYYYYYYYCGSWLFVTNFTLCSRTRQLELEGLFNSLAMRLAHGKRPAFQAPTGTDLAAMTATIVELERTEQERKVALYAGECFFFQKFA